MCDGVLEGRGYKGVWILDFGVLGMGSGLTRKILSECKKHFWLGAGVLFKKVLVIEGHMLFLLLDRISLYGILQSCLSAPRQCSDSFKNLCPTNPQSLKSSLLS